MNLICGPFTLDLRRPQVMGILNVTPDSFSEGGTTPDTARALAHAHGMLADGADLIDVGGESTRPGAHLVPEHVELDRILPVVAALAREGVLVSVDTMKPTVMRAVIAAGAAMINDVRALQQDGALESVADSNVAVCLMHMQGEPRSMQDAPIYVDVVNEVRDFLIERALICEGAGIARNRIALDPGFGFGKSLAHNLALLKHLDVLAGRGYPVLAGLSRKAMIGTITGRKPGERMAGSVAAAVAAVERGAAIVRVHDVRATVDALRMWQAIRQQE
ncbi:MAG: dihydropteroate synthase [Betaproteobacteria bacterium]